MTVVMAAKEAQILRDECRLHPAGLEIHAELFYLGFNPDFGLASWRVQTYADSV